MTFSKERLIEHVRVKIKAMKMSVTQSAFKDIRPELELDLALAEMALAGMESEPVAYVDPHTFQNFSVYRAGETDNKRMGREWMWANPDAGLIPVYTAPQTLTTSERAELQEYRSTAEFMPKNLDRALTIMGVSLPESKEEFNLQAERWMQRLIDRVIRCESELAMQSGAVKDGWVAVPLEPSIEHLRSIAMRSRHDFYLMNDSQKLNALATARQMYEECSGQGYFTLPAAPQQEA